MALEIKQSLRLSQQLVMTPQLQQAIKLLQLNRLELAQVMNQELVDNPLLEDALESPEEGSDDSAEESGESSTETPAEEGPSDSTTSENESSSDSEIDWEGYLDDLSASSSPSAPSAQSSSEELPNFENILTKAVSLEDHLLWQLHLLQLTQEERAFGELVIGNLNEEGYLTANLSDLAREAEIQEDEAEEILKLIQKFDPVGIAARDLKECLLSQAEILVPRQDVLEEIIRNHLDALEKRQFSQLARQLNISQEDVHHLVKMIKEFDPKPGLVFSALDSTQYITPDIYIKMRAPGEYTILLNEEGLPRLRISQYYRSLLKDKSSKASKEFLQEKLRSAVWLIRSIHNRQKTIYRVTESILKHQKEFFEKGVEFLRPMVLKSVAQDIGVHESTVSRVTTNKFVHTPRGTFELKYFFNSGVSSSDGGADYASESVKEKIRQCIAKEDLRKPLSDQELTEILKKDNVEIARRTVAKYREALGILSSSRRRKLM